MEASNLTECPLCHHAPILHKPDGLGGVSCTVCLYLVGTNQRGKGNVCTQKFQFRLSEVEREHAQKAYKGSYPQKKVCAVCDCYWMAHDGYLCPSGDTTFVPVIEGRLPFLITH